MTREPRMPISRWILWACALAGLAGCGDQFVAGSGGGGSTTGTGGQTSSTTSTLTTSSTPTTSSMACEPAAPDDCQACLADNCAGTYCQCLGSTDCVKLVQCLKEGAMNPMPGYQELCAQKHKPSIALVGNLTVCSGEACSDLCGTPAVDSCLACQYESCPTEINNCLSNYLCNNYIGCVTDCGSMPDPPACAEDCKNANQTGADLYDALASCAKDACVPPCGN